MRKTVSILLFSVIAAAGASAQICTDQITLRCPLADPACTTCPAGSSCAISTSALTNVQWNQTARDVGLVCVAIDAHTADSSAHHAAFTPNANPGVDHSSYVAGHTNGANCTAGNYPLGVDAAGAAEGCTADADTTCLDAGVACNFAASSSEGGAALTGDSATAFFAAGQIEAARGGTGIDSSASTGVARVSAGTWTADAGVSHLASSTSAALAGVITNETGSGLVVFDTAPTLSSAILDAGDAATGTTRPSGGNRLQILTHDTDCTSLTGFERGELCWERDADSMYVCEPTAGNCDTAGEWIAGGGGGGSGDVVGPASSLDNEIPRYDSTTGKLIQGSGVEISDAAVIEPSSGDIAIVDANGYGVKMDNAGCLISQGSTGSNGFFLTPRNNNVHFGIAPYGSSCSSNAAGFVGFIKVSSDFYMKSVDAGALIMFPNNVESARFENGATTITGTLDVSGVTATAGNIGASPPATCTAGTFWIDTDETVDTNCTTTNDNSLCLCVAADTWIALENN